MPVSQRKLPKNAFKRKIKQALFEIVQLQHMTVILISQK